MTNIRYIPLIPKENLLKDADLTSSSTNNNAQNSSSADIDDVNDGLDTFVSNSKAVCSVNSIDTTDTADTADTAETSSSVVSNNVSASTASLTSSISSSSVSAAAANVVTASSSDSSNSAKATSDFDTNYQLFKQILQKTDKTINEYQNTHSITLTSSRDQDMKDLNNYGSMLLGAFSDGKSKITLSDGTTVTKSDIETQIKQYQQKIGSLMAIYYESDMGLGAGGSVQEYLTASYANSTAINNMLNLFSNIQYTSMNNQMSSISANNDENAVVTGINKNLSNDTSNVSSATAASALSGTASADEDESVAVTGVKGALSSPSTFGYLTGTGDNSIYADSGLKSLVDGVKDTVVGRAVGSVADTVQKTIKSIETGISNEVSDLWNGSVAQDLYHGSLAESAVNGVSDLYHGSLLEKGVNAIDDLYDGSLLQDAVNISGLTSLTGWGSLVAKNVIKGLNDSSTSEGTTGIKIQNIPVQIKTLPDIIN